MARELSEVVNLFEQRERDYLLSKTRVKVTSSLEKLDAGDYKIESVQAGESIELPRWMAEELVVSKLAETQEESFETEVFKALSREKMMGPLQLSVLREDFYIRMRRRVGQTRRWVEEGTVKKEEYEKLKKFCYDLVGMRLGKLLSVSSSSSNYSDIGERLTPEEKAYFEVSKRSSLEWKKALLGEAL